MKFDLHPWELARKELICEGNVDFEVSVDGRVCQFRRAEARRVLYPYFRFSDAPEEHFVFTYVNTVSPEALAEHLATADVTMSDEEVEFAPAFYHDPQYLTDDSALQQEWQRSYEQHCWGRYFLLDANLNLIRETEEIPKAEWSLLLLANGLGALDHLAHNPQVFTGFKSWNSLAPFQWHGEPAPAFMRSKTALLWLDWLHQELKNPQSSIRLAYDLANHSEDEANFSCTHWKAGDRREWEEVSRWVLQTENSLWEKSEIAAVTVNCRLAEEAESKIWNGFFLRQAPRDGLLTNEPATNRLALATRYFTPSLDANLIEHNLCVARNRSQMKFLRIQVEMPSAHERLEAALGLKAWAQDKFSAEEIAILCGPSG